MKLPKHSRRQGFTLIELLVVIAIIAILASLAVPAITGALVKGQLTQSVNNARQIYLAGFSMANDATVQGDPKLGWPGDLYASTAQGAKISNAADYMKRLTDYEYLKSGDLMKIVSAPGVQPWDGIGVLNSNNMAFKIYQIKDSDGAVNIFAATKNFTYGKPLDANTSPYKDKGFVVLRKGGDGTAYSKKQAEGDVTLLGLLPGVSDPTSPGQESQDNVLPQ